ncbi:hypothetical protein M409DRAFT_62480 [Zasmidium cellare ATCC 36951]|uniref:Rrp15p-domain-containing protein n=1 Tax=Zasmidium cellare ATCC 36951 TaxID=1080233 RepID=A0A6A6D0T0_ZASCE|nr:uncharacterized protein M409DRAFT_62480 [Zasmidium cellare ATCC 36951]KAF2172785.1 hypothetical protein M409DRAFT_62480 [Zasmidium cellare ATCC 36951]
MAPIAGKRRRVEDEVRPKKKIRKFKKQARYHSSSEDEDEDEESAVPRQQRASDAPRVQPKFSMKAATVSKPETKIASRPKSILKQAPAPKEESEPEEDDDDNEDDEAEVDELEKNTALNALQAEDSEDDEVMEEDDEPDLEAGSDEEEEEEDDVDDLPSDSEASMTSSQAARSKKKRNDPTAFATSISKILDTKLSTAKRQDPVLSRSKSAADANKSLADSKLEQKARAQIRAEKKQALEKGRIKDVLGLQTPNVDTGAIMEQEKRLKKTAQRGVVRLFNAVRAAQVKAEEAMKDARAQGVVGMQKREEKVNEMSKQGFLDLISAGGKQKAVEAV